jgi:spore maturation protein CgeB
MKILCVFGKYQYGDAALGIGPEYAAFIPALKNLGHEVIHFESEDRSLYPDYAQLNAALLKTVERERPEILLSVQQDYEIWIETLQTIQNRGDVATICWTTDDSWKYREVSRFIGKYYHAMTTTYPDIIPQYQRDGIPNVLLTQWAANSQTLREPLPAVTCRYGISFVGAAHGNRSAQIRALQQNGIQVTCFGNGWPNGPVSADRIPDIMQNSVISLNFSNAKGENQIKARTFEVPGAGGFLLTEHAGGLERYYTAGKEVDVFRNKKEMMDKIEYYLANDDVRDTIARAGFERTRKENTYETRMQTLLEFALAAQKKWLIESGRSGRPVSMDTVYQKYYRGRSLKILRGLFLVPCKLLWGEKRGPRALRRITFELSWRLLKERTFSASGLPGRLFPEQ